MADNPITEEFSSFLESLKSPDNAIRDAAEAHLDKMKEQDCLGLIQQFFNALSSPISPSMKAFIAVILRKVISNNSWEKMQPDQQEQIRGYLLDLFAKESEAHVRRALCDLIIQVLLLSETWPQLYQFIVSLCQDNGEIHKDGLYLLGEFCVNDESTLSENLQQVVNLLSASLTCDNYAFQVEACRSTMKILVNLDIDQIIMTFISAVPSILTTIQAVAQKNDEDDLISLLGDLDEVMDTCCGYMHDLIRPIIDFSMAIAQEAGFSPNVRQLASHIIATVAAENGGFFRKNGNYITQYLNIAATMISTIDDDPDWENGIFGEEDELLENDNIPHVVGINMVANIANALHGAVYKPATQLISQCKDSANWKERRVAYVVISHIADGCKKQVENDLKTFLNILLSGLNDSCPRIVFVALQAIAYCSVALPTLFQKKCGVDVIRGILTLINKNPCLRLQAMIASCLGQFCAVEMITRKIFKNTLPDLVQWLFNLCTVNQPVVQTEAIAALGYLCRAVKADFAPFFHQVVQGLLGILGEPVKNDTINVHVSASMCLSSLVSSMGDAASKEESWNIMQFLMNLIEKTPLGDERLNCLLDCAAEIYQYLEVDHQQQFLTIMIPYLINICKLDVGLEIKQVVQGPEYAEVNGYEISTMDAGKMGKVQLSINTSAVEAVSNAVRLLHNLLIDGKQRMLPYAAQIYEAVKPLVDFSFHEDVRNLCARILPKLFEIMVNGVKEGTFDLATCVNFYSEINAVLIEQYQAEDEANERNCIAESLRDVYCCIYESGDEDHHQFYNQRIRIDINICQNVAKDVVSFITESCEVLEKLYSAVDMDDRDLEDARNEFEEAAGEEKDCIENLLDCLGYIIRYCGDSIAPCFNSIISPMCQKYMTSSYEYIRFVGICPIDDMMLYATSVVSGLVADILTFFGSNMTCEDPSLRQAVLFGIKIIVEKYPQNLQAASHDIYNALVNTITNEEAFSEEYAMATENAASALFSLLLSGLITGKDYSDGIAVFIDCLPLDHDTAEAQTVHEKVVYALQHSTIFNNCRREILKVLPLMLFPTYDEGDNMYEISYDETKAEIINILKSLNGAERMDVFRDMDPEMKATVMSIMNN